MPFRAFFVIEKEDTMNIYHTLHDLLTSFPTGPPGITLPVPEQKKRRRVNEVG